MRGQPTTPENFYARGVRTGDCLLWSGKGRIGPYGVVGYRGVQWLAHRLSYHFATGEELTEDDVIRHTCDTPLCIEPRHLKRGTHADNVDDKMQKGRHRRGETHPLHRLSATQVHDIRDRYAQGGIFMRELAAEYGVRTQQISRIVRGERWKVKGD